MTGDMMESTQSILGISLFLILFLSGFWLSRTGKPYSKLPQAVHKLIGVGMGVFLVLAVYHRHQAVPLSAVEITMVVVTVILFAGLVASGALLTSEKTIPALVFTHKVLPYLAVISTGVMIYLLY